MKAYKAFNKDLTCRDFQYEIGKTYEMTKYPIACKRGFHACTEFDDVFNYYEYGKETRICEVELLGDIDTDLPGDSKVATNKIKIVRELSKNDFFDLGTEGAIIHLALSNSRSLSKETIQNLSIQARQNIVRFGSNHHRTMLLDDPCSSVRCIIAEQGTNEHRDILINDNDDKVRRNVAIYGMNRHRDILVHDQSPKVRCAVAINGANQHRDILVNDTDATVRFEVASWGNTRHRDILANDVDSEVRAEVARSGNHRHHNILIKDSDAHVRRMVAVYGDDKHRKILSEDEDSNVRDAASRLIPHWLLYR